MTRAIPAAICIAAILLHLPVQVHAQSTATGLDFPGSSGVTNTMRFKFANPQNNGLPIYGPSGSGVTYIWRAYPRQQSGYYTAFFWGNDDGQNNLYTFLWVNNRAADTYYGAHPYPQNPPNGNTHYWEISIEQMDFVNGTVQYNRWHTQALRVWADANGKHHEFYWDLPNTDAGHRVTRTSPASWGNVNPPAPALTWGDAPWAPGNEVWNGILRGIQIYSTNLSLTDILNEVNSPLSSFAGASKIWYLNINPTPTDISDKSGKGHHPTWVGSERPKLYSSGGTSDTTAPAVSITAPLNGATMAATPVTVSGTASDNVGVAQLTWTNAATGGSGTATGTTSWTASIPLGNGSNAITVKARDAAGNTGSRSITVTLGGGNNAAYLSHSIPSTMTTGSSATVSIAMKNTGTKTWTGAAKYALGHSAGATPWTWRERRVWLAAGESVAPGATKTFSFTITAPSTAGTYAFPQWRMVQEGVEYFGTSSPALDINVTGGGGGAVTKSFQNGAQPTAGYAGTRDAYITRDTPTTNFGTASSVVLDGDTSGTGNDARALLRWYVTDIPIGSTVQSAKIVLYATNSSTQTYEVYRIYRYWSETQATWNQAQTGVVWQIAGVDGSADRGQTVRGSLMATSTGAKTITLNAVGVSMVQAWVNDPASNFGVILLDSANVDSIVFASKEAATASQRPRLEVTYTPPTAVLSDVELAPADGAIDGEENPLTLQEALGEEDASPDGVGSGGETSGGSGGSCGALGMEAALLMILFSATRRRSA